MSAYICDKGHIIYLVAAAMAPRLNPWGGPFRWSHDGKTHSLACNDFEAAKEAAMMLLLENIRSVSHRYPNDKSSASLPGATQDEPITAGDFARAAFANNPSPVQVLKSIACLEYQSCEHPGWTDSEAHAFLRALERRAINALPGYDEAAWGAPARSANPKSSTKQK